MSELFQWKVDLGSLIQIVVLVFGVIITLVVMKYDVKSLKERLHHVESTLLEITKTLTSILISDARTDERISDLEERPTKNCRSRTRRNGSRKSTN